MMQLEETIQLKRIGVLLIFVSFTYGLAAQLDNETSILDDMSSPERFEQPSDLL